MRNKAGWAVSDNTMRSLITLIVLLAAPMLPHAADFKGATEVLRQAAQTSAAPKEKSQDPYSPFREKLKAFQSQSTNLPPAQAATQWLALVEEFQNQSSQSRAPMRG